MVAKDESTRSVVKRLREAGFTRTTTEGSHAKWVHPSGAWVSIPDGHRMISPGVVRQVDKVITQSKETTT